MVVHIAAVSSLIHIHCVRPTCKRVLVALTTLVVGLLLGAVHRPAQRTLLAPPAPAASSPPERGATDATYPDDLHTDPFSIANFLRAHPNAKLGPLWRRLGIPKNNPYYSDDACSYCEPNTFECNLDGDSVPEVVLQIKEAFAESAKYLIFKQTRDGYADLIGHVETWSKYDSSDPVVLASNGQTWLIIEGTAATGSDLAAWLDTVYDVSNGRVKPVATYLSRVRQNGHLGFPSMEFAGSPVSGEVKDGNFILTLSYTLQYSGRTLGDLPLFTKKQKVVLVNSLKSRFYCVDGARSDMSTIEFESIYKPDSINEADFLRYNRFELFAIALGNDAEKKQWLREFLDTCPNYPVKRELMVGLSNSH